MIITARIATLVAYLLVYCTQLAKSDSLADIDHVVLFMQENRAFDHYFGTMPGVRGFADANLQMNGARPVWNQVVSSQMSTEAEYINPWYLNYLGGEWNEATQCMFAGSNGWYENHAAWNNGSNNHWAMNNTVYSIGYFQQKDIPIQWALADGWVVADMYQEGVVASTNPNRVIWVSGSINSPGSPQRPDQGGNPYIDNNETPGCDSDGINCYPLKWKTTGDMFERANVSWTVFQDADDNFDDNPHAWFGQFQEASLDSPLHKRGIEGSSMASFYSMAANETLPELSYIIGPRLLSEHTPYMPRDGGWLQRKISDAIIKSPKYNRTALIISYDETGGWADHVDPFRSPAGTPGEWIADPTGDGSTFVGPGFRVPLYVISPWTRHGGVYSAHADHNSQILFLERWQAAKGRDVRTTEMVPWRRANMDDLVDAFDFSRPDYTTPELPDTPEPHRDSKGHWDGSAYCAAQHAQVQPPPPYTGPGAVGDMSTVVGPGFKPVRGLLTEGRYLTLETSGVALAITAQCGSGEKPGLQPTTAKHDTKSQRWVVHAVEVGRPDFILSSAACGEYICAGRRLCGDKSKAIVFTIAFTAGKGYTLLDKGSGEYWGGDDNDNGAPSSVKTYWQIFSVKY